MGFGGMRPAVANPSIISSTTTTSSASLVNSALVHPSGSTTPSSSTQKFELNDEMSFDRTPSIDIEGGVKERIITKIDPVEMTGKSTVVTVAKDPVQRSAMLLAGPKFRLNVNEIPTEKLTISSDTLYRVAVCIIIALIEIKICFYRLSLELFL
jgi:hypothetical protein